MEGVPEDNIVATAIYYYKMENVETKIEFERSVSHLFQYEQNDYCGLEAVYGIENDKLLNQKLGDYNCKEGSAVCFPNIYVHRAHGNPNIKNQKVKRGLIVFFLVNPNILDSMSTLNVLPQNSDWYIEPPPKFTIKKKEIKDIQQLYRDERSYVNEKDHDSDDEEKEEHKNALACRVNFELCEH